METMAFKRQATIHAEAQTEDPIFTHGAILTGTAVCFTTTLLLIGSKPGRGFIFPLISTSIFFT